jgi:hypothetical protein
MEVSAGPSHVSEETPQVYVWTKKVRFGNHRGRLLQLHDGTDVWMFWSVFRRCNRGAIAEPGQLFHITTRRNGRGTLNVCKIERCRAERVTHETVEEES